MTQPTETDITKQVQFLYEMLQQCSPSPAIGMEIMICLHVHMWKEHKVDDTTVDTMLDNYTKTFKAQLNRSLNS